MASVTRDGLHVTDVYAHARVQLRLRNAVHDAAAVTPGRHRAPEADATLVQIRGAAS